MEGLIELVAASFARHGIECPASDSKAAQLSRPTEQPPVIALPEHSFRQKPEGDGTT